MMRPPSLASRRSGAPISPPPVTTRKYILRVARPGQGARRAESKGECRDGACVPAARGTCSIRRIARGSCRLLPTRRRAPNALFALTCATRGAHQPEHRPSFAEMVDHLDRFEKQKREMTQHYRRVHKKAHIVGAASPLADDRRASGGTSASTSAVGARRRGAIPRQHARSRSVRTPRTRRAAGAQRARRAVRERGLRVAGARHWTSASGSTKSASFTRRSSSSSTSSASRPRRWRWSPSSVRCAARSGPRGLFRRRRVRLVVDAAVRPRSTAAGPRRSRPGAGFGDDGTHGVDVVDITTARRRAAGKCTRRRRAPRRRASRGASRPSAPASPGCAPGRPARRYFDGVTGTRASVGRARRSRRGLREPGAEESRAAAGGSPETPTARGGGGSDAVSARSTAGGAGRAEVLDRRPAHGSRQRRPGPRRRRGRADAFRRRAVRELERVRPGLPAGRDAAAVDVASTAVDGPRSTPPLEKPSKTSRGNSITSTAASPFISSFKTSPSLRHSPTSASKPSSTRVCAAPSSRKTRKIFCDLR